LLFCSTCLYGLWRNVHQGVSSWTTIVSFGVIRNPEDLPGVLRELKGGRVEFRNDRLGIVHTVIGKKSFTEDQLRDNLYAFVDALVRAKPSGAKGIYCRTLTITSSMAPGIALSVSQTLANATAAAA
jgi:large subunit ribosomal protein L1